MTDGLEVNPNVEKPKQASEKVRTPWTIYKQTEKCEHK